MPVRGVGDGFGQLAPGIVLPARDQLEGRARPQVRHRPVDHAAVRLDQAADIGDVVPGEDPPVFVRQALDRAQVVGHGELLSAGLFCSGGPGPAAVRRGPGPGLHEHVLALRLVTSDGHLAPLVAVVAAAAQLELRPHLVERPAALGRDRAWRHGDAQVDVARPAAVPVGDLQLVGVGQDMGQVEVRAVADGGEADVEAPAAADAVPQPPLEVDTEADLEGVGALDDGVVDILVIDVEDVGVPVRPQVPPGRQQDLRGAVEPVGQFRRSRCRRGSRCLRRGCGGHEASPLRWSCG